MEVINIEAHTFEAMLSCFEAFSRRVEILCGNHADKGLDNWLDNQDVCLLLNISPRTLQTLRDNGSLAFSRINHKIYYKPKDIEGIVPLVKEKRKQAMFKGNKL